MSTVLHELPWGVIEIHGDNEVRIRTTKRDPVKLRLAIPRDLLEGNIGAVSFDLLDGDTSDEVAQVGARMDGGQPGVFLALKLPGADHVSEVVHVTAARALFAVPIQAPNLGGGLQPGMNVALRSLANGRLVCAEAAGTQPLVANRDQVGPWETFEVVVVP